MEPILGVPDETRMADSRQSLKDSEHDPAYMATDTSFHQSCPSTTSAPCSHSNASSLLSIAQSSDVKASEVRLVRMDSTSDLNSDERSSALKQKFWDRVRRSRGRRHNTSMREGYLGQRGSTICSRRTTRNIVRFSYLAAACAFTSIITLYFSSASTYSAFDMAFGAFSHPDGYPLDVHSPFYPSTFLRSVMPIPCHSHNDQWRHTPLHAALGTGCISIEADVWASPDPSKDAIFVGHDQGALLPDRTLQKMYIQPLINILAEHNVQPLTTESLTGRLSSTPFQSGQRPTKPNGVFALSPQTSLTILLDFKSPTADILPSILNAVNPLIQEDWLTHWDPVLHERVERPITIVASGDPDFELLLRAGNMSSEAPTDIRRYVFYDAPLDRLVWEGDPDGPPSNETISIDLANVPKGEGNSNDRIRPGNSREERMYRYKYNPSNSHLASTSLSTAIGAVSPLLSRPDSFQRKILRQQIREARDRGLISRYWGTPRWPRGLRDNVWETLEKEGVGLLSVDDLRGVRKGDWARHGHGRWWGGEGEAMMGWLPRREPEREEH